MKKFILILMCLLTIGSVFAQQLNTTAPKPNQVVRVIKIRHISPYLLALILSGHTTFTTPSEPNPHK